MKRLTGQWHRATDGWRRQWRRRRARVAIFATLGLLVLSGAYMGVREVALRSADHLRVTVTQTSPGPERLIYQHTFGRSLAAQMEHLLNDETTRGTFWRVFGLDGVLSPHLGFLPTGSHPIWSYQLDFLWHGIVIESARTANDITPEAVSISALGFSDLRSHITEHGGDFYQLTTRLASDSNGAIPVVPHYGQS